MDTLKSSMPTCAADFEALRITQHIIKRYLIMTIEQDI